MHEFRLAGANHFPGWSYLAIDVQVMVCLPLFPGRADLDPPGCQDDAEWRPAEGGTVEGLSDLDAARYRAAATGESLRRA